MTDVANERHAIQDEALQFSDTHQDNEEPVVAIGRGHCPWEEHQHQHQVRGEFGQKDWCKACQRESQTWSREEKPCACECVGLQSRDVEGSNESECTEQGNCRTGRSQCQSTECGDDRDGLRRHDQGNVLGNQHHQS